MAREFIVKITISNYRHSITLHESNNEKKFMRNISDTCTMRLNYLDKELHIEASFNFTMNDVYGQSEKANFDLHALNK